jgi:hypothetical protein
MEKVQNLKNSNSSLVLCAVLSCLIFELLKLFSSGLEPSTVFGFMTLVPVMFFPKQVLPWHVSSLVLIFLASETIFLSSRTQYIFQGCVPCPVISSPKQTPSVLAQFFYRD